MSFSATYWFRYLLTVEGVCRGSLAVTIEFGSVVTSWN